MELLKNLEGLTPDEQMTAVVELQKAAMQHLEEQKQASIGKSAELVIQGLKKIKSDFEERFNSLNYDIQTKVASLKDGEQGLQGPKGDQGERGLDGSNGRDGRDGKDGKDGVDGVDGVGVRDAKIDFDGSLVISLTDGREINCGEVVSVDVAKQIQKVTHNIQTGAGGDSQTVLDAIAALQATIATYGTMATQNANNVAITGGNINNTVIGGTTPVAGTFTTLRSASLASTGTTLNISNPDGVQFQIGGTFGGGTPTNNFVLFGRNAGSPIFSVQGTDTNINPLFSSKGSSSYLRLATGADSTSANAVEQLRITHTASAVNYVQVTGAATTNFPTITAQGSDTNIGLRFSSKGTQSIRFDNNNTANQLFRIDGTATAPVNYLQAYASNTTLSPIFSVQGSDTNISQVFQSKGTGAIDLAAGSSGVNISNGGTVTAITRTAYGSGYTSLPTPSVPAPTTAGGVQAVLATSYLLAVSAAVSSGGTGYTVNDVLTISGGTFSTATTVTVSSVSGGVVTGVLISNNGNYSVAPSTPAATTGGTGTGCTIHISYGINGVSITNAGSGYVEQPTVTFSGGGGSGAAAYATVGGTTTFKTIGGLQLFNTPAGTQFSIADSGGATPTAWWGALGSTTVADFRTQGGGVTAGAFTTQTAIPLLFRTNFTEQLRIAHTASAVNYVQVTGAATGSPPQISAQGSDTNAGLQISTKGSGTFEVKTNNFTQSQFTVTHTASAVNRLNITGSIAGSAPILSAQGLDPNIDIALSPQGTGYIKFGTLTATADTAISGYITIRDAGGTLRKLAVIT